MITSRCEAAALLYSQAHFLTINSISYNFAHHYRRANNGASTFHRPWALLAPLLVIIALLSSCAAPTIQHPGALNSFDSTAYDTLITEQAAIEQAKVNISNFPQFKVQLNNVILQYNTTMEAYKVYHNVGSGDISSLQTQISSLVTNVASLIKSMIPVAPQVPIK